jgi:N-acetylmuramoyl-L-alanine amidase
MASEHTVEQGEHLTQIAARYGFADYRTIWDHPRNADLKRRRQNPNVLYPGDVLFIPDKVQKKEAGATGQRHRFQVSKQKVWLRVIVKDLDDQPIAGTPYRLEVEGQAWERATTGDGLVEQLIPKTAQTGTLTLPDLHMEVPFRIGHLDPVEETSGWQARLNNLGYNAGTSNDPDDPQLRSAIEEFQCDYDLTVDGLCGPQTQGKLKERHGS